MPHYVEFHHCLHCLLSSEKEIQYFLDIITCDPSVYILKPSSNWSLFKLIISDQTLIKNSTDFLLIYVHFNGQKFSSVFEQFSFTSKFFGLKCKNRFFLRKNGFESSFYKN